MHDGLKWALMLSLGVLLGMAPLAFGTDTGAVSAQPRPDRTAYIVSPCSTDEERVNGRCTRLTPAQKAERDQQRAAEAARAAKFEADVKAEMQRLGAHREAEIRRKLELRDRALAARPTPQPGQSPKQCTRQLVSRQISEVGSTRTDALLQVNSRATASCGIGGSYRGRSEPVCAEQKGLSLPKPPIGDCLACISMQQAVASGYVPGKGWPQPASSWTCNAMASCEAEVCPDKGPSAVTQQ